MKEKNAAAEVPAAALRLCRIFQQVLAYPLVKCYFRFKNASEERSGCERLAYLHGAIM